jgi:hypothetical protein
MIRANIINLKHDDDEQSRRWNAMCEIRREQIERIEDALADNFCTEMSPEESKAWLDVALATLHWKRECRCCINIDDEVTRTFMAGVINALRDPALAHRFSEELEPIAFALKQLGWAIGADSYAEAEGDDRDFRRIVKNIRSHDPVSLI